MNEEKLPEWLPVMRKLQEARKKLQPVGKDAQNPAFRNKKYATINAVLEAIEPVLFELNLAYLQVQLQSEPDIVCIRTSLIDLDTGSHFDSVASCRPLVSTAGTPAGVPQAMGIGNTYLRRYGLLLVLGLQTEDDDGNGASGRSEANQKASGGVAGLREKVGTPPKRPVSRATVKVPLNPEAVAAAVDAGFPFDLEEWCKELEACESLDELDLVLGMPKKAGVELKPEDKSHAAAVYRRRKTQLEDAIPL